jgi:hypothetical protein
LLLPLVGLHGRKLENGLVIAENIYIPEALEIEVEAAASNEPSEEPTEEPTMEPTESVFMPTSYPTSVVTPVAPPVAPPTSLMPTVTPSAVPSFMPTVTPSAMPSAVPTAMPSLVPTAITTATPSAIPTPLPTSPSPVITFTSSLTISGVTNTTFNTAAKNAVCNATASGMGISMKYCTYLSTTPSTSATPAAFSAQEIPSITVEIQEIHTESGSTVISTTSTTINTGSTDPTTYYNTLTSNLDASVSSGTFNSYLHSASTAYGATATASATCTNVTNSEPTIVYPSSSSSSSSNNSGLSAGAIAGIVIGSVAGVILIGFLAYYFMVMRNSDAPLISKVDGVKSNTTKRDIEVIL